MWTGIGARALARSPRPPLLSSCPLARPPLPPLQSYQSRAVEASVKDMKAHGLSLVSHNVIYHLLDQIRGIMEGEGGGMGGGRGGVYHLLDQVCGIMEGEGELVDGGGVRGE